MGKEKVESAAMEIFEGISCCILITGHSKKLVKESSLEFCAQSSLPYGGSEAGIHSMVPPEETPDNRWGAICSVWVPWSSNSHEKSILKLSTHFFKRIRGALLPKLAVRVFSWDRHEKIIQFPQSTIKSSSVLGEFAGEYSRIQIMFGKDMLCLPLMGGDFLIEEDILISHGYLGANLFVFFTEIASALEIESKIHNLLLTFSDTCQIYGLAASGTRFLPSLPQTSDLVDKKLNLSNSNIQSNLPFCPSLRIELAESSKVPPNVKCIPEIVLNGYSMESLKKTLIALLSILILTPSVIKISAGSYGRKLGHNKIYLKNLINLKQNIKLTKTGEEK